MCEEALRGQPVGVFAGVGLPEQAYLLGSRSMPSKFAVMGSYPSVIANRVSGSFDWTGPSVTIVSGAQGGGGVGMQCSGYRTGDHCGLLGFCLTA